MMKIFMVLVGLSGSVLGWFDFKKQIKQQKRYPPKTDKDGWYYISVMHRGESVLYTDEHGSTYVDMGFIPSCYVISASIQKWNWTRKMTEAQREIVLKRVVHFLAEEEGEGHKEVVVH